MATKKIIYQEALGNRWVNRNVLAKRLFESLDKPPHEETIIKIISEARNHAPVELDRPWSIGCLVNHHIDPAALPIVLAVYYKHPVQQTDNQSDVSGSQIAESNTKPLSIREILWVARLCNLIDLIGIHFLERYAIAFALEQKINELLDVEPSSTKLDLMLLDDMGRVGQGQMPSPFRIGIHMAALENTLKTISKNKKNKKSDNKGGQL